MRDCKALENGMQAIYNEDTMEWEIYNPEFDITIHCTSQEEYDRAVEKLKALYNPDAIPVTELKAHIYKMNHRDIRSALVMDGYKQALEEMLGWIVGYGEDSDEID